AATPRRVGLTMREMAAPVTAMSLRALDRSDPDIANLIRHEYKRQSETLELIASENLTSPAILEALGTSLTTQCAAASPGRRAYTRRAQRLRRHSEDGRACAPEDDHRRVFRVSPHRRLGAHAADRRLRGGHVRGGHGPRRRAGGGGRVSIADPSRAHRHHDD